MTGSSEFRSARGVLVVVLGCACLLGDPCGGLAADTLYSDGFEAGDSCDWSLTQVVELCDGLDNDCSGVADDGDFADAFEPNESCAQTIALSGVGSNQTWMFNQLTVYPDGDEDVFSVRATETDASCTCCDPFCTDEDYRLTVELTAPVGGGSLELCVAVDACGFGPSGCVTVAESTTEAVELVLDGDCTSSPDEYDLFIRVGGHGAPGFTCKPYQLSYSFVAGVCG